MDPAVDLGSPPKKRITPVGLIVAVFVAILLVLLIMPSSRDNRISKAKERFARDFPIIPEDKMQPLLGSHLMVDGKFVYDSAKREGALFIFAPGPTAQYGDQMMRELQYPSQTYSYSSTTNIPIAVLLAPEESSQGWTIFAKVWIAKALQKQSVKDLKELGMQLSSNPKAFARLKSIWKKLPLKVRTRATQVLEENRSVAKLYSTHSRFYRGKVTYVIDPPADLSDFLMERADTDPDTRTDYVEF